MILFSSVKLERALASKTLDSWSKAKYVIAIAVVMSLSGPIYSLTPTFGPKQSLAVSLASQASTVAFVLLTYFGIRKCYRTNTNIDDTEFIMRYTILSVPMTVKFATIMIPAFIGAFALVFWLSHETGKVEDTFLYVLYLMTTMVVYLFYVLLNRSFKRLGQMIDEGKNS